jgi:hypothetical protein
MKSPAEVSSTTLKLYEGASMKKKRRIRCVSIKTNLFWGILSCPQVVAGLWMDADCSIPLVLSFR